MKRLLDVGNCGPDHGALCDLIERYFDAEVVQAHGMQDALEQLRQGDFALVTINRLMDHDGSSGLEIIQQIKQDATLSQIPVMLVSNYEDFQDQAMQLGAARGYGKSSLQADATRELLSQYLEPRGS
ncbi:MAG: response regulator [Planctomycetota bacterium]